MRSACPTAMTTSRVTPRSWPTKSSSLDLASGRITYRSKSKLTVDAVVTFSGFGAGFGGAGGGCGGGAWRRGRARGGDRARRGAHRAGTGRELAADGGRHRVCVVSCQQVEARAPPPPRWHV